MAIEILIGTTGYIDSIYVTYASGEQAGQPYTGLTPGTSGLAAYYYRNTATGSVAISLVSGTLGSYTEGGFVAIPNINGGYQIGIPNGALASGATSVIFNYDGAVNMLAVPFKYTLYRYIDANIVAVNTSGVTNQGTVFTSGVNSQIASGVWSHTTRSLTVTGVADIRLINGSGLSLSSSVNANIVTVTGYALNQISSGVWNMAQTGFITTGTFGHMLDRRISEISVSGGGGGASAADIWGYTGGRTITLVEASGITADSALGAFYNRAASGIWNYPSGRSITLVGLGGIDADSMTDGAIRAGVLDTGAIFAEVIAPGAITSGSLHTSAIGKISSGVWNDLHSGYNTSGTFGNILDRKISEVTASGGAGASAADVWSYATRTLTTTGHVDIRLINGELVQSTGLVNANVVSMVTGTISSGVLSDAAITSIQNGLATSGNAATIYNGIIGVSGQTVGIRNDTISISGRLPTLLNGFVQSTVQEIKDNAITSASLATSAVNEMASGIFQFTIENNVNFTQLMRALGAINAGLSTGGGTTGIAFQAVNNAGTTRVAATVDSSGNRSQFTLNLGS